MTTKNRDTRLALRRDHKFGQHNIEIREAAITEERFRVVKRWNPNTEKDEDIREMYNVQFTHSVYAGSALLGRTRSRRSALKLAHQTCRNRSK